MPASFRRTTQHEEGRHPLESGRVPSRACSLHMHTLGHLWKYISSDPERREMLFVSQREREGETEHGEREEYSALKVVVKQRKLFSC